MLSSFVSITSGTHTQLLLPETRITAVHNLLTCTVHTPAHTGVLSHCEVHLTLLLLCPAPRCAPPLVTPQDLNGSLAQHTAALTSPCMANSSNKDNNSSSSYQQQQQQLPAFLQQAPSCGDQWPARTLTALMGAAQQQVAASLESMMRAVCSRLCNLACLQGW